MGRPILVLLPRYTVDSRVLRTAAVAADWTVMRLATRRLPEPVDPNSLVFYGEPGFVDVPCSARPMTGQPCSRRPIANERCVGPAWARRAD